MVRSAVADDSLLTYLTSLVKQNPCTVGLILGQSVAGKDYVIHFAKTPPFQTEEEKKEDIAPKPVKSITEINDGWVADHAKHATRMLPGGMYVLGIFIVCADDVLNPVAPKIKSILTVMHKQLATNKFLFGNVDNEKLVLNYCSKTQKFSCKSFDVNTSNVVPADFKFLPKATKWNLLECKYELDQVYHIKEGESNWPLKKHMSVILNNVSETLKTAVFLFDGEAKDGDENLENIGKKKKVPRSTSSKISYQDIHEGSKPMQVSIFQSYNTDANIFEVNKVGGQIRVLGQVACKLWLQPKVAVSVASTAVMEDIMRSLATRFEMHWDSLTEEEHLEDINSVHEPPRRVLVSLPNSKIAISDYLFPGEGPQDVETSLEEMLDIKIENKSSIQDVEGLADISEYYTESLESESEIMTKMPADSNKFMYMVGLGVALFVLILSLIVHVMMK